MNAVDGLRRDITLRRIWEAMGRPRCHLIGGFVRDHFLGRHSGDIDFSMPGDADSIALAARRLADVLETRPLLLGRPPRCVWRIESADLKIELWPLGGLSLEADIRRRDFACNALCWRLPDGPLIDHVDGVADIAARRLRAIARGNLDDDPVRCLRAARLLAQLDGFRIEPETMQWTRSLAHRLAVSPRERVGQELLALLRSPGAGAGTTALLELGLLGPSAPAGSTIDQEWLERNQATADALADPVRHPLPAALRTAGDGARLAFLVRAWGAPAERDLAAYGWPRQHRVEAARAAALLDRAISSAGAGVVERRTLIYRAGPAFPSLLAAACAVAVTAGEPVAPWRRWWDLWVRSGATLVEPQPLLSAVEVAAISGVAPGPPLGRLLKALVEAQVRAEVRTPQGARRWLRRRAVDHGDHLPFPTR